MADPLTITGGILGIGGIAAGAYYETYEYAIGGALILFPALVTGVVQRCRRLGARQGQGGNEGAGDVAVDAAPEEEIPVPALAAQITRITFPDSQRVSLNCRELAPPHFQRDRARPMHPAILTFAAAGGTTANIRITVTRSILQPGTGVLTGTFGGVTLTVADCPLGEGEHDVVATVTGFPDRVRRLNGNSTWQLVSNVSDCNAGTAALRIYTIFTDRILSFSRSGVWTTALDFLIDSVDGIDGCSDRTEAVAAITTKCHSNHGLSYGSSNSYAYNDERGISFCLQAYLLRTDPHANCYDQAGAVTILSHALGVPVLYRYIRHYGFINATNLMGVADCNNPGDYVDTPFIAASSHARTGFCNHAFATLDGMVFDACVGPYLGTRTIAAYLADAIDSTADGRALLEVRGRENQDTFPERLGTAGDVLAADQDINALAAGAPVPHPQPPGFTSLLCGNPGQATRRAISDALADDERNIVETLRTFANAYEAPEGQTGPSLLIGGYTRDELERHIVARMDADGIEDGKTGVNAIDEEELRTHFVRHLDAHYSTPDHRVETDMDVHAERVAAERERIRAAQAARVQRHIERQIKSRAAFREMDMDPETFDQQESSAGRAVYNDEGELVTPGSIM